MEELIVYEQRELRCLGDERSRIWIPTVFSWAPIWLPGVWLRRRLIHSVIGSPRETVAASPRRVDSSVSVFGGTEKCVPRGPCSGQYVGKI